MNRAHYELGPAHTHTGTLKLTYKENYGLIHHDQIHRIALRHTFVSQAILRDSNLLSSHDCQVLFTFDSAPHAQKTIRCTWASLVPPVPHVASGSSSGQFGSILVPLGITAAESTPNAYWEVPQEVRPMHVRTGLQWIINEYDADVLDKRAQTMLNNQDPEVGFAAINHFSRILREWGLEHPSSWLVKTIKDLQGSMDLPATLGHSRKGSSSGRSRGSPSSGTGSFGTRTFSRSRSRREREREKPSPPSGFR